MMILLNKLKLLRQRCVAAISERRCVLQGASCFAGLLGRGRRKAGTVRAFDNTQAVDTKTNEREGLAGSTPTSSTGTNKTSKLRSLLLTIFWLSPGLGLVLVGIGLAAFPAWIRLLCAAYLIAVGFWLMVVFRQALLALLKARATLKQLGATVVLTQPQSMPDDSSQLGGEVRKVVFH